MHSRRCSISTNSRDGQASLTQHNLCTALLSASSVARKQVKIWANWHSQRPLTTKRMHTHEHNNKHIKESSVLKPACTRCCLYRSVRTTQREERKPAAAVAHTGLANSSIPQSAEEPAASDDKCNERWGKEKSERGRRDRQGEERWEEKKNPHLVSWAASIVYPC